MLREARRQDSHPAQGPVDDWSGVSAAAVESFATADSSADAPVKPTEIQGERSKRARSRGHPKTDRGAVLTAFGVFSAGQTRVVL